MEKLTLGSLTIKNIFDWIVHFFEVLFNLPLVSIFVCLIAGFVFYAVFLVLNLIFLHINLIMDMPTLKDVLRTRRNRIRRELNTAYIPKYRRCLPIARILLNTILSCIGIFIWNLFSFLLLIAIMGGLVYLVSYVTEKVFGFDIFNMLGSVLFQVLSY